MAFNATWLRSRIRPGAFGWAERSTRLRQLIYCAPAVSLPAPRAALFAPATLLPRFLRCCVVPLYLPNSSSLGVASMRLRLLQFCVPVLRLLPAPRAVLLLLAVLLPFKLPCAAVLFLCKSRDQIIRHDTTAAGFAEWRSQPSAVKSFIRAKVLICAACATKVETWTIEVEYKAFHQCMLVLPAFLTARHDRFKKATQLHAKELSFS